MRWTRCPPPSARGDAETPESEGLDERARQKRLAPMRFPDLPLPSLVEVLDHVDHIVRLVGIDHVGIGHDFSVLYPGPAGLEDVSKYGNLTRSLLDRGYTEAEIRKFLGGNLFRAWTIVTSSRPGDRT